MRVNEKSASSPLSLILLLTLIAFLGVFLLYPLGSLAIRSISGTDGFTGLATFQEFFATPGLVAALKNSVGMGLFVTVTTLILAFTLAYAATHTRFRGTRLCLSAGMLPLFVPSIFPALGLMYLFGSQGVASELLGETSLYGPLGIFLGSVVYTLPHALLPLVGALSDIDGDLYSSARILGAGPLRRFLTVTVAGTRYGMVSSAIVIFVLTITDFGIPKVLGGDFPMLATEIFKQVIGLHDFSMGAAASLVLLLPCLPAFVLDAWARKKQRGQWRGARYVPGPNGIRDATLTAASGLVVLLPLAVMALVVWGSFISFWPYDLTLTIANYRFEGNPYGMAPLLNSIRIALLTMSLGTLLVFLGAYLAGRCRLPRVSVVGYRLMALLPLAIPGTVLGLAYILAFNTSGGWMQALYGSIPFLACNCVIHFYTVGHFTATGSIARLDPQYESVGQTLGVSRWRTALRVVFPMQKHGITEVALYLFVNALTTISAVVFLYSPESMPASVATLHMLETGAVAEASAMGCLILAVALVARLIRKVF